MAGTTMSSPRGAEISERSTELILPEASHDVGADEPRRDRRELGLSEAEISTSDRSSRTRAGHSDSVRPAQTGSGDLGTAAASPRGIAMPGDRGPKPRTTETPRPSFWRRIALGRRGPQARTAPEIPPREPAAAPTEEAPARHTMSQLARDIVAPITHHHSPEQAPEKPLVAKVDTSALETRIVEPMLQALVSVEAKLERSHSDLTTRSDQVEQRLTQLWDIEEQLGTLSELQESLLNVSEQQRRLESAVVAQTRTLRWLVGAVFVSLAGAAFTVAFFAS